MNTNVRLRDILCDSCCRFNLRCILAPCKSDRGDLNNLQSHLKGKGSFSFFITPESAFPQTGQGECQVERVLRTVYMYKCKDLVQCMWT